MALCAHSSWATHACVPDQFSADWEFGTQEAPADQAPLKVYTRCMLQHRAVLHKAFCAPSTPLSILVLTSERTACCHHVQREAQREAFAAPQVGTLPGSTQPSQFSVQRSGLSEQAAEMGFWLGTLVFFIIQIVSTAGVNYFGKPGNKG